MEMRSWIGAILVGATVVACDGGEGDDTADEGCSEADLDACEYPSPGLTFTERNPVVTESVSGRELPLRVRIPDGDGPFAIVVYSHGGGFDDNGHAFGRQWAESLASHGYVTVNIGHASLTVDSVEPICTAGQIPVSECNGTLFDEDSGLVGLVKRLDVIAVLDAIPGLAEAGAELGGPDVDLDRIAVIGWSAGSRSTFGSRGLSFHPSPSAPVYSVSDDRVASVVGFSPAGPGFGGLYDDEGGTSWDTLDGPTLVATGQNDVKENKPELTGLIRRQAYELQPADGSRRLLYSNLPVGTGGHGTFNLEDLGSSDEDLDRYSRALQSAVRAFLDDTLWDDAEAHAWLETDDAHVLAGDADWESK